MPFPVNARKAASALRGCYLLAVLLALSAYPVDAGQTGEGVPALRGFANSTAGNASASCAALGKGGLKYWSNCEGEASILKGSGHGSGVHVPLDGKVTWGCPVPGFGVALCDESRHLLRFWDHSGASFTNVGLAPLTAPVGAVYQDGKVYVACFGSWPTPQGDSGLAVVDVATGTLEASYVYSGDASSHLHNVYAFDWDGRTEIFVAVLGNPWSSPPVIGAGLVRFDLATASFVTRTTDAPLSARSAVQQSSDVFYVLTQEPAPQQTRLARLERQGSSLRLAAEILLPARPGGDGGADVLLGKEPDTVFCTDRTPGGGKLYFYAYRTVQAAVDEGAGKGHGAQSAKATEASAASLPTGFFEQRSARDTGANPRHATLLQQSGDVVVCNQDEASLTVFPGLAHDPTAEALEEVSITTLPVSDVSFFMMSSSIP